MAMVSVSNRDQFFKQLAVSIERKLNNKGEGQAVESFAKEYFKTYPLDELEGHQLSDVYGSVYWWWSFIQSYEAEQPKIAVFNPNLDEHGWLSQHTVVCILHRDMPFLMDSIRLELSRRDINIHTIHSTSLSVLRDQFGDLVEFAPAEMELEANANQQHSIEALLYFEIALHSRAEEQKELAQALIQLIGNAALVVEDFKPMKEKVGQIIQQLKSLKIESLQAEIDESVEFLYWLADDHFTFMGYVEFYFSESKEGGELCLREVTETRLGLMKLRGADIREMNVSQRDSAEARFNRVSHLLGFSKSSVKSRIHREAYSDYIIIKCYDDQGKHVGEYRIMGLYTANVYLMNPTRIPVIRKKIANVLAQSGLTEKHSDRKLLSQVLHTFPRDELFQSTSAELAESTIAIMRIKERRRVRLFIRRDRFGKFITCLVYVPRDLYNTELRRRMQTHLMETFNATASEFNTFFSESILARTYMNFRVNAEDVPEFDPHKVEQKVIEISRSWDDLLLDALMENMGEERGTETARLYRHTFPAAYRENFEPRYAVKDIQIINGLSESNDIAMTFYRPIGAPGNEMQFKLYRLDEYLALSDIIPILENMGLRVLGESPYELHRSDSRAVWIHDFHLRSNDADEINVDNVRDIFRDAFKNIWSGMADNDGFNRLIVGSLLTWREVAVLRAYSSYMKQINFNFSKEAIVETLARHTAITNDIVTLFKMSFDPQSNPDGISVDHITAELEARILGSLEGVENLNEDTILRRFLDLIRGTLRTNFYQMDEHGQPKPYFAVKFSPRDIPEIPLPTPLFEIFVYSPRVEGLHLRGGRVARGGLRWSDRKEDFRTEILGLVKAQQVKNAVIVPVGAKGGFVAKQLPENGSRDDIQREGIACYKLFVQALLDLTDNLVNGEVVRARDVVRKDDDDTYLVVAADKGTATFSDIANELSLNHGFWLGDAFASGGSAGYDHKKMGITAKGAWVSVQRHFRERGLDIQQDDFTVIGIGDMAGDVFGNGLLMSNHIRLVAAFNHMHIFVDPNPDAAKTLPERKRLFDLPRSTWGDFDKSLMSAGGGIFSRAAKSIDISPQMAERFAIQAKKLTPNQLISAILKAPVDLLWNGGIGTYVKAKTESHADVGDKANDVLRVNGCELRCSVIGEGGNLGVTQLGRTEYALNGGALNTDFIDNAGGVDCSDHEVNIKILLNEVVSNGDLTTKQRNLLLGSMTDEVAALVLKNNYRQVQAISLAEHQGLDRLGEYRRYVSALELEGKLNRSLEFLPDDETIQERKIANKGLTRNELSILLSYSKAILKEDLAHSNIAEDECVVKAIETAFPPKLREKFATQIYSHRLRKEIVATQLANDLVNHMGFTFVYRMRESTGATPSKVAKAYVVVREIFAVDQIWRAIEELDDKISAKLQLDLMSQLMRLIRRGTRWFLRNHRSNVAVDAEIALYSPAVHEVGESLSELLEGELCTEWRSRLQKMLDAGVPDAIACKLAGAGNLNMSLGVAEVARRTGCAVKDVAQIYFALGNLLDLNWFTNKIADIKVESHWQALARENLLDDVDSQQRAITAGLLVSMQDTQDVEQRIDCWMQQHQQLVDRWRLVMNELRATDVSDFSFYTVALRDLLDLAQSSQHQGIEDSSH